MNPFKRRALLGVSTDAKTVKGEGRGYLTGILYLAPARVSGRQVCPMASDGCRAACLYTAGRGGFSNVQAARISKTDYFFDNRAGFLWNLAKDIRALVRKAERGGLIPVVRLNGTSDIMWERVFPAIFTEFPHVQFYDYTKIPGRTTPANYHLTFSRSESNGAHCMAELERGTNLAVVFNVKRGRPLPNAYAGAMVVDGDLSDLRFLDPTFPTGCIVGLRGKGDAKGDSSGFVVDAKGSV